jgi:hypothetical protein
MRRVFKVVLRFSTGPEEVYRFDVPPGTDEDTAKAKGLTTARRVVRIRNLQVRLIRFLSLLKVMVGQGVPLQVLPNTAGASVMELIGVRVTEPTDVKACWDAWQKFEYTEGAPEWDLLRAAYLTNMPNVACGASVTAPGDAAVFYEMWSLLRDNVRGLGSLIVAASATTEDDPAQVFELVEDDE